MSGEFIKLKKPNNFSKIDATKLFSAYLSDPKSAFSYFSKTSNEKYLYWDKARFVRPLIGDFSEAESWVLLRQIRRITSIPIKIKAENGQFFSWLRPIYTDELLRKIDMHAGGLFLTEKDAISQSTERQKYLARGIVEESIASSQLEGADTSSRYAKKMIAENIKPRNKSEQMILNNYRVLQKIENEYKDQPLTLGLLQTLQMELTEKTLSEEYIPGNFRRDEDDIVVWYDQKIAHVPPKASFVQRELIRLIEYANSDQPFVHPVIKAIELHFWLGYLHPFPDGNGRLARSIFYWYLTRHGYWAFAYLPISSVIKRSQHDYAYSYIYSEQDDLDFTYFFDYNIRRIVKCIDEFQAYIERKSAENSSLVANLQDVASDLNSRQINTIRYLVKNPSSYTTAQAHSILNGITLRTAYSDLKDLKFRNLVIPKKQGKTIQYYLSAFVKKHLDLKND